MKKYNIYILFSVLFLSLPAIGGLPVTALYKYIIKEATGPKDEVAAKTAAALFQNIDFKGNIKAENEFKTLFDDKFKKPISAYAPAQGGGIPSDLKASSEKIGKLITEAKTPEQYLTAFKTIVTDTGKPAVAGLKAKGVSASEINSVLAELKA